MAATRTTLKQYFKKYATPTEEQFAALIDAFVHKDEDSLTQSKIDGLTAALESKVSSSDLASAVATAVEETLQGGNIEVTPAAHNHAIADVKGLQAFVNKVNNFLESADVSDETINRWAEIETFLTGITDQETLAGLLLNLKNEILAQIPEPQTGNYLKQISDLDAYTEAQEGEIVQYVGSTTENYTRGFCYERVMKGQQITTFNEIPFNDGYSYSMSTTRYNFTDLKGNPINIYDPPSDFKSSNRNYGGWYDGGNGIPESYTLLADDNPIGKDLYLWSIRGVLCPKCYSVEYSGERPMSVSGGIVPIISQDAYAVVTSYDFELRDGVAYVDGIECSGLPIQGAKSSGNVPKVTHWGPIMMNDDNQLFHVMLVAPYTDAMTSDAVYLFRVALYIPLYQKYAEQPIVEADLTKSGLFYDGTNSTTTKNVSDFVIFEASQETIQIPTWQPIATSPVVS